jgi:hypothetical protein
MGGKKRFPIRVLPKQHDQNALLSAEQRNFLGRCVSERVSVSVQHGGPRVLV